MTPKDKSETSKTPAIRELQEDEIDSVSGGIGSKPPTHVEQAPYVEQDHYKAPTSPGYVDPDPTPRR